jgi:8-oxo-dGTP pyrophosphatase MutT (NUDIX family)
MSHEVVVRDAATTVLLRDAPGREARGLETLLLRRHAGHVFGANAYVFPGGAIDADDSDPALAARCGSGVEQALAQARGRGDDKQLAAWMAAIRECFEEAGLLVGCAARAPDFPRDELRQALNAQHRGWAEVAEVLDLEFALDELVYFAHWTTPPGPPKRYSTRFFAAAAPPGEALCDGHETTRVWWAPPEQALAAHDRGEIALMTPTRATLETLCDYDSVETALAGLVEAAALQA